MECIHIQRLPKLTRDLFWAGVLVTVPVTVMKYPDKCHSKAYFDSQLEGIGHLGGEVEGAGAWSDSSHHIQSQEAENDECLCTAHLVLFL